MDDVERVKEAIDPIAFISQYTPLKRRGDRYWGLSPFTNEKTPSFSVRPDGLFYCFSSNVGGDILRFIELKEGLSFREALERAAEFAGITLEARAPDSRASRIPREAGLSMLSLAASYFHRLLLDSSRAAHARAYLAGRDFGTEIQQQFQIGYAWGAEHDWTSLVRRKGLDINVSRALGLTGQHQDNDRFRNRVMFPIQHPRGHIAGFGGRRLDENERAKYINSPDSPWFHKGQLLFGYPQSRPNWQAQRTAIVCEGYTDVIRLHACGYPIAVAPLGTAMTVQQASRLAPHVDTVILAYDADAAGQKAGLNAWSLLVQRGVSVRLLELPPGEDPDSFFATAGTEEQRRRLDEAPDYWTVLLHRFIREAPDREQRRSSIAQIIERLAAFDDVILAEMLAEELAEAAGVTTEAIRAGLNRQRRPQRRQEPAADRPTVAFQLTTGTPAEVESALAAHLLQDPELRLSCSSRLQQATLHPWLLNVVRGRSAEDPAEREWIARQAHRSLDDVPPAETLITEAVRIGRKRHLRQEIAALQRQEAQCRRNGDATGAHDCLVRIDALNQELAALDRAADAG